MPEETPYYTGLAAAYVRGRLGASVPPGLSPDLLETPLEELSEAEQLDLQTQTIECIRLLKKAMSPQGFNLGINLGRCAGAGLPGHIHQHVVPRWGGDTNFMTAVGEVRVVPEAMSHLWGELMKAKG